MHVRLFITELLVFQELKNNPDAKILYLAPLRSLSRELKERYGRLSYEFNFVFVPLMVVVLHPLKRKLSRMPNYS